MEMEASAARGFARILTRLDATTRDRYCAQALEEELVQVLSEFGLCAQAMAHAAQVDVATKSLVANAASATHFGSPTIVQLLQELGEMQVAFKKSVESLVVPAQPLLQARATKEAEAGEELRLLAKTRTILTKRRRSTWLNDAVETARAAVRLIAEAPGDEGTANSDAKFDGLDYQVYETMKMLRKALVENMDARAGQVPVLRKMLKKVAKKRPSLAAFVERSDQIIATKEKKNAEKEATGDTRSAASSVPTKTKKRRLSEAFEYSTPTPEATRAPSASTDIAVALHAKAQTCYEKAVALGDVFSLSNFDLSLKLIIEIVNSLSPMLRSDTVGLVTTALFSLVDKADKIKVVERRKERLVCLEALLSVVVTSERLAWKGGQDKAIAQLYLSNCRRAIDTLQSQNKAQNVTPPAQQQSPAQAKKLQQKPQQPAHEAGQQKQQKQRKQTSRGTKKKSSHMRFDE